MLLPVDSPDSLIDSVQPANSNSFERLIEESPIEVPSSSQSPSSSSVSSISLTLVELFRLSIGWSHRSLVTRLFILLLFVLTLTGALFLIERGFSFSSSHCSTPLSSWIFIFGFSILFSFFLFCFVLVISINFPPFKATNRILLACILLFTCNTIFKLIWLIWGQIWLLQTKLEEIQENQLTSSCSPPLYHFTSWLLNLCWFSIGTRICISLWFWLSPKCFAIWSRTEFSLSSSIPVDDEITREIVEEAERLQIPVEDIRTERERQRERQWRRENGEEVNGPYEESIDEQQRILDHIRSEEGDIRL
jgi:hypothetical protein